MANKPIIVLDPGHGGRDPGGTSGSLRECDKTLAFVKVLAKSFEATGCQVVLTRSTDTTMELDDRTKLERSLTAACIISVHMDWAASSTARGASIWMHCDAPMRYMKWANDVLDGLRKVGYDDNRAQPVNQGYRGRPSDNYAINRDTRSPSMLLELGFLTNPNNARDIETKAKPYAQAIVAATRCFLNLPDVTPPPASQDTVPLSVYTALQNKYNTLVANIEDLYKHSKKE